LNFALSPDQSYFETFLPDILDANNNYQNINVTLGLLGSSSVTIGGQEVASDQIKYDADKNSIRIYTSDGFKTEDYANQTLSIVLGDSLELEQEYTFTV
jgi:hypothetical protein